MLDRFGGVYEDQDLLVREAICQTPNNSSIALRKACAEWGLNTADSALEANPRLASAAILMVGKFGLDEHIDELARIFTSRMGLDTPARQQALVILVGANRIGEKDVAGLLSEAALSPSCISNFCLPCSAETSEP